MLTFDLKKAPVPAGCGGCRSCRAAPHVNNIKKLMDTKKIIKKITMDPGKCTSIFRQLSIFEG